MCFMKEIKSKKEMQISNSLVAGKYHLTKEEQNLIFLVASQIDKTDENFKKYRVSVADLEKATGRPKPKERI